MSNLNWIEKLKIDYIDEEDGTGTIHVEWDETDPDLAYWTSLGPDSQRETILEALRLACDEALSDHVD